MKKEILDICAQLNIICWDNGPLLTLGNTRTNKWIISFDNNEEGEKQMIEWCQKYIKRNGWRLKK